MSNTSPGVDRSVSGGISDDEVILIKKYRALDERGKITVDAVLDAQQLPGEAIKKHKAG